MYAPVLYRSHQKTRATPLVHGAKVVNDDQALLDSYEGELQASSVKDFSREKLEKLFTDSIKKLKARDKQILEVSNERDTLARQLSEGQDQAAEIPNLQAQLQVDLPPSLLT